MNLAFSASSRVVFSNPHIIALLCFHHLLLKVGYWKYTAPWFYMAIIYIDLHALPPVSCIFLPSRAGFVYIGLLYEIISLLSKFNFANEDIPNNSPFCCQGINRRQ